MTDCLLTMFRSLNSIPFSTEERNDMGREEKGREQERGKQGESKEKECRAVTTGLTSTRPSAAQPVMEVQGGELASQ